MSAHPRPWHRGSSFSEGLRHPLDRERCAQWKARLEMHRRAKKITAAEAYVGHTLLKRLGTDGRLDPAHQTLADDAGVSTSTVQRAVKALHDCGLLSWIRRVVRTGARVAQTSNSYLLTLGRPPAFLANRCECQHGLQTREIEFQAVQQPVSSPQPKGLWGSAYMAALKAGKVVLRRG